MDIQGYIDEIVDQTIRDFENDPTSVRRAFLACVVTFHCVDYLKGEKSAAQLRQEFGRASKDFALVDRIAHALKHKRSGHPGSRLNPPLEAGEIISRPPGIWDVAVWDLSRWDDPIGGVTIQDDVHVDVMDAVRGALSFIREQLPAREG